MTRCKQALYNVFPLRALQLIRAYSIVKERIPKKISAVAIFYEYFKYIISMNIPMSKMIQWLRIYAKLEHWNKNTKNRYIHSD
jgi:hypothetical protein